MKQIYLIGYMGSGKSTIGHLLAERLQWEFVDLDQVIESRVALSIPEIFRRYGESEFRRIETSALAQQGTRNAIVVACGGGVPCIDGNLQLMKDGGTVIYLKVDPDAIVARVQADRKNRRPLLENMNDQTLREHVHLHLRKREEYYEQAHIIISANEEPEKVADNLCALIDRDELLRLS